MSRRTNPGTWMTIAIFLAVLSTTTAPATTINIDDNSAGNDLVSPGEIWKFFKGTESPGNPPDAWKDMDFDDSNWLTGPGGFGYGDDDDATVLEDMRGNYVSVYIRKEFTVSSVAADEVVTLEIDYDDGFIAYLNGTEIARAGMPDGAAAYDTTAASAHEAGSPETFVLGTAGELLNEGINVLAIEGHNSSASSSDFSLIPALRTASNITKIGETWIVETDMITLKGRTDPDAVSVLTNGIDADFNTDDGSWSIKISLNPGLNSITIKQLNANAKVINTRTVEIMYVAEVINVAGELTENTTWSGVCVVEGTIVVPAGIVLKIEPGTMVRMKDAAGLLIYGQLLAKGTESSPIHFTRYSDGMSWKQIMFVEAADSRLAHCVIEYADSEGEHQDYYEPGPRTYHEAVVALACHIDIENCIFRNLPDESGGAEGDAIAIISDDQDHTGEASANIQGCEFLSIGQGVHTRYSCVLVEECFFTGKRGDNDDVDLWGESTPAPLIRNNLFLNPEHDDMINPTRCSAVIVGNIIIGCDDHGIVLRDRCFPVLMNNLIADCSSAGIAVENSCEALLMNNTIVDCGRGIRLFDLGRWGPPYRLNPGGGTATVINCIIWDCPQPVTLADSSNTEIEDRGSHITVKYSNIEGGQNGISVSGSRSTVTWGQGNINSDPQFAAANDGDYHLKSQAGRWDVAGESWVLDNVTSPCVDAGDPNSPVAFEPYPNGSIINMGVYGGTPEASKSPSGLHAKYGGGIGEPNDPYLIYTAEQMNTIGAEPNDWDKHFKLMADIDLSVYTGTQFNRIGRPSRVWGGSSKPFTGVFDGATHIIRHFAWNATDGQSGYTGLFALLGSGGHINNLSMENVDVNVPGDAVGGLVGRNDRGTISNCSVTGRVLGREEVGSLVGVDSRGTIYDCSSTTDVSGERYVGGLIGESGRSIISNCHATGWVQARGRVGGLIGEITAHSTISNCYATGSVSADSKYVGGLIARIAEDSTISGCYATGDVYSGDRYVGGLVGVIAERATISNCYATGVAYTKSIYVGGLVGFSTGMVSNTYAVGQVFGSDYVGGLIGYSNGWVMDSFWDLQTSGLTHSAAGEGKTTAEMKDPDTFIPWVCSALGTWTIDPNNDYPRLVWQGLQGQIIAPPEPNGWYDGGSGMLEDPYRIATAKHIWMIGMYPCDWDKHFVLVADVNLAEYKGSAFRTIGRLKEEGNPANKSFIGVFDGNDHTIRRFEWNSTDPIGAVGLFGWLGESGQIKDLYMEDVAIDSSAEYLGGLIGINKGTIFNCNVTGQVWGRNTVGGLAGFNEGMISNSSSSAQVAATYQVGGLVGLNNRGTIVDGCATGNVSGNHFVGGLAGRNLRGMIINAYASGQVVGKFNGIGGLVGKNAEESIISDSYATGSVIGDGPVGGLVGRNIGSITKSYSTSSVTGYDRVGGLVGSQEGGGVTTNSFWDVQTSSQSKSAGGEGKNTAKMKMAGTFLDVGWDFVDETDNGTEDIWWILEGQDYPRLSWEAAE